MIPAFNASMVLPPFMGGNPTLPANMSPYKVTLLEVVERFATSPARLAILEGLIAYRAALVTSGIAQGFQWLDGSFVEDIERSQKRPPKDIDIISFAYLPVFQTTIDKQNWMAKHFNDLFNTVNTSQVFKCDAYFVDLGKRAELIVDDTRYWFGLFSHQRVTSLWKGMLQIEMKSDDADAILKLNEIKQQQQGGANA